MKNLADILVVFFLFFFFTAPSTADIRSVKIRVDDRNLIRLHEFGFTHTGIVSIRISSVAVTSIPVTSSLSRPDPSRIGFFLVSEYLEGSFDLEGTSCSLDSKYITTLFTLGDLSPPQSSFNKSYHVTYPDKYALMYANCNPLAAVAMDVRSEFYNIENDSTKNYLSDGLMKLPCLYFIFSIIYLYILLFWIFLCFKERSSFHRIHVGMFGLLVMKGLNYIYTADDQFHLKVTGTHRGWDVKFYLFQFIRAKFLFIMLKFISTRVPFMNPSWQGMENKATMMKIIIIPTLQVLAVVASVACIMLEETGPFFINKRTWIIESIKVNWICFFVMSLPFVCWCILENTSETDGIPSPRCVISCGVWVVAACLMFGRILAIWIIINYFLSYKHEWVCYALDELGLLVIYMVMVYILRPLVYDNNTAMRDEENEL